MMTSCMIKCQLHREMSSPRDARSVVRGALPKERESVRDLAVLLTNELVTNALLHGAGDICLELERTEGHLRVEVADAELTQPVVRTPDVLSEGGRGVVIVDALASAWGVREIPDDGKTVWFELNLDD
jgi:anti-sigma regulatory factor (Ser/Thr protein kinase)